MYWCEITWVTIGLVFGLGIGVLLWSVWPPKRRPHFSNGLRVDRSRHD